MAHGATLFVCALARRGRARYFSQTLSQPDLDSITKAIHALIGYGAAIQKELGVEGDGIEGLLTTYSGSLEKPHWPPQVEKTPLYLKGQEPPPQEPNRKRGTKKGKKGS